MKELSIEEKAKAYDEAIEKANKWHNAPNVDKIPTYANRVIEELFPELKESEDEKVRKELIVFLEELSKLGKNTNFDKWKTSDCAHWIAWLENQGEHANFRNKIQIGDKVTRNEDGVLVNLSQLKRVAKPAEVQGEQKPADETPYPETLEKAIDLYYYSYGNGKGEFEHLSLEKFRDIVHTFVSDYGQKPTWSEEDEHRVKDTIYFLDTCYEMILKLHELKML